MDDANSVTGETRTVELKRVRNEGVVGDLLADTAADDFANQDKAIHTYPIHEVYTLISAGRPTEVGLCGYPAVQTISSEAVLHLLFGDAVRGLEQLKPRT
ncbi:hypothetical protein [Salinifilum ghardaiensis]